MLRLVGYEAVTIRPTSYVVKGKAIQSKPELIIKDYILYLKLINRGEN